MSLESARLGDLTKLFESVVLQFSVWCQKNIFMLETPQKSVFVLLPFFENTIIRKIYKLLKNSR